MSKEKKEAIKKWMAELQVIVTTHKFPPEFIFNMDEIEMDAYGERLTFGFTITASGELIRPLVIFPFLNLPPISDAIMSSFCITGEPKSGYFTKEIWGLWLNSQFLSNLASLRQYTNSPDQAALLILDLTYTIAPAIADFMKQHLPKVSEDRKERGKQAKLRMKFLTMVQHAFQSALLTPLVPLWKQESILLIKGLLL